MLDRYERNITLDNIAWLVLPRVYLAVWDGFYRLDHFGLIHSHHLLTYEKGRRSAPDRYCYYQDTAHLMSLMASDLRIFPPTRRRMYHLTYPGLVMLSSMVTRIPTRSTIK